MSHSRFNAIDSIAQRTEFDINYVDQPSAPISEYFGKNVFDDGSMKKYLPEEAYINVKAAIQAGTKLNRSVADQVAMAMKKWSMDKGATHFAHWFQPLTGKTAEKHDSFFTLDREGMPIEEFSGGVLAQQEPDGSSFPGGGLRSTFEARGYTAWDPSSPAFILEVGNGKTLCIPTIFVTYSGEALDYKLPLLKSQSYVEEAALAVCSYFKLGATKVITTLGWEQEYFLVDEALFNARPDLVLAGRTLVGKFSPKGQQLDDHYFGSIPERVFAFMRDLEIECHLLGIPVRTRHNEVGPGQYELAPMYEEVNVAVDHNQLLMDLMDRVGRRHKLRVLLHEKPFGGVNGSGKHNNWSLATNTGINLLSPGKEPNKNLLFLTFFVNTIQAVYRYADLLRASVASAGNDHRLGANEAPPAIISVFIGEALSQVLDNIEEGAEDSLEDVQRVLNLLSKVPDLEKDNTDRNRTSPFAFTGNKFEIRMVGSQMNCSAPMTIMNTIVGRQLRDFKEEVDAQIAQGRESETAILNVLEGYIAESKNIRFEGDGYSQEWEAEAARRGLTNAKDTPSALKAYVSDSTMELFTRSGVMSHAELEAHYDVKVENYILTLQIEARTLGELCTNYILPAAFDYQSRIAQNMVSLQEAGLQKDQLTVQFNILERMQNHITTMQTSVDEMIAARKRANHVEDVNVRARQYCDEVKPLMESIRYHADKIEFYMDDQEWPLIKYRELMFMR
jgi:glutamine synthetase